MTWGAIGGAAVAVVGSYLTKDDSSGGGGGANHASGTQQNMQAADPFAGQRFQYQQALAKLMGVSYDPSASNASIQASNAAIEARNPYQGATGPNGFGGSGMGSGTGYIYHPGLTGPQPQSTPPGGAAGGIFDPMGGTFDPMGGKSGSDFVSSDPSYDFRLKSGSEAVQRAMGSRGMNGSGNMMAALMQYGQNLASTEYQNDFTRSQTAFQNNFTRSETAFQNNFNNLATLSGAMSGSPAAAGQLGLQGQQMQQNSDAAALAQWNQWLQPAAKAVGGWLSNRGGGGGAAGGGDGGGASTAGGNSSYSDPFASSAYTV